MEYLEDLILIFGLAVVIVLVFSRLKLPPVVGYLFAGVLIGPHGLGWVEASEHVQLLAEIGVALLLFSVGIEFSLADLARIRKLLFVGGGLQVILSVLATALVALAFGLPFQQGIFYGMLVALSSTAIVLRLLAERNEVDSPPGQMALGILIFQDLCVVPMTLLTPFLGGGEFDLRELGLVAAKAVAVVAGALLGAKYFVPRILGLVAGTRSREIFFLCILLLCLGTALLTAQAGLSLALGAFLAGLILSQSEYSHQALGDILPFRSAFSGIFFVSIGMLFNARLLLTTSWEFYAGILGLILGKAVIIASVILLLGFSFRAAMVAGLGLAQVGEFSFALARFGSDAGVMSEHMFQLFVAAAVLTMVATPFLWGWSSDWFTRLPAWLKDYQAGAMTPAGEKTSALRDHVIIAGYGVNGRNLARVVERMKIPYVVLETNPQTVREGLARGVPMIFGDVSSATVIDSAGVRHARVLVMAISDPIVSRHATDMARRANPAVHIIVRTRYVHEMEPLFRVGASEVVPEEFETSIEIFARVLRCYLVPSDEVERSVREIRQDGYEMFRELRQYRRPARVVHQLIKGVDLEVYRVERGSRAAGQTLAELRLRSQTGVALLAIRRGEELISNPAGATRLETDDLVVLFGTPEELAKAAGWTRKPSGIAA